MKYVLLVSGTVFLILFLVNYLLSLAGRYGKLDRLQRIPFYIDGYMRGGFNRTRCRIRDPFSGKHIWFVKLTSSDSGFPDGVTRFFLQLPESACTPEEFQRAQQVLTEAGIDWYVTTDRDPAPRAIIVHCDMDVDKAVRAARCILIDVFGLSASSYLRYGVFGPAKSSPNTLVGWDDHPQLQEYLEKRAAAGKPIPERFRNTIQDNRS